ncbi:hypothetical protein TTHERM_01093690 (macronuclear) [Tetrahymena thermophila SB210]|uniref:Uncharacterized protein n=1 Tax=Tetrahymena thermophila (strain SB210) TaxID=312017 RepID=Q22BM6_TETTS|nr:hypothetical protein TTHERM_01093690 [Tetrahymena thermophila SB210]EAR82703.4 hypothetical protein TTHERM_01093690 [Tetrahymena thermophila SB210]|eukprot:XP_001030366.4 hypothetical protein TTHERM_01093690 [Tetrahymena thermophila SB210]
MASQINQSSEISQIRQQVIQDSEINKSYNVVQQESVFRGEQSFNSQPYAQIYTLGKQQQQEINFSSDIKTSQQNNIKSLNSSITRKVIHYENPRKYVEYNSPLKYDNQAINYTNKSYNCQQCNQSCTCNSVQISLNPSYRFKITREIDLKQAKFDNDKEYEQLLLKVQNLEAQHIQEISKLKQEFNTERQDYEKETSRHQLELLKTVYVEQQEIAKTIKEKEIIQEQKVEFKEKSVEVEKHLIQIEQQTQQIKQLEEKVSIIKQKKRVLSEENQQLKQTLFEKELSIKQLEIELQQKLYVNGVQSHSNLSEIETQNLFLIQELGRITEENEQLKKNGNVIEKLVYVPSVQSITKVKEVPPYIEEKVIYVQDTDQLEACQKIINQLQQENLILSQEKQKLILAHAEEKTQLMERITNITQLQKSDQANIIKEVVVQKVIDRTEIQLKEEELQESYKKIQEYSLRIAELEQSVQSLQLEIQRLTRSYKIFKLPNSYRIEQSIETQNTVHQTNVLKINHQLESSVRQVNFESSVLKQGSSKKQEYSADQTIKRNMGNYLVETESIQQQQNADAQSIIENEQQNQHQE